MDHEPEPPPRPSRILHLCVAWSLILALVAGIVVLSQAARTQRGEQPAPSVAPQATDPQLAAAQMALALRALGLEETDEGEATVAEIAALGDGPLAAWRSAVIAAELQGEAAARERLAAIELAESDLATDVALLYQILLEGVDAVAPSQRLRLRQRHGWFGDLALSHQAAADDPLRSEVVSRAIRLAVVRALLSLGALGLLIGGVVASWLALLRWRRGTLVPVYRADPDAGPVYASAFALYLVAFVAFSVALGYALKILPAGTEAWLHWLFVPLLSVLVVLWLRLCGVRRAEAISALGLHPGRGLLREAGAGLVGYLAGIPLVILGLMISLQLSEGAPGMEHPMVEQLGQGGPLELLALFLLAVGFAPLVEELTFRGLLYHHLRSWYGPLLAALIQGLLFAAVHPQGVAAIPVLAALGMVFAFIREWRGSLVGPIVAHAVHNGMMLTAGVLLLS